MSSDTAAACSRAPSGGDARATLPGMTTHWVSGTCLLAGMLALAPSARAQAQVAAPPPPPPAAGVPAAPSVSSAIAARHATVRGWIEAAARRMPADKYGYRPVPEVMSFGEIIVHVAFVQWGFCANALGEPRRVVDLERTGRVDALAVLAESFAYCERAYVGLDDARAVEVVPMGTRRAPRVQPLVANVSHNSLEYGKLATYLRMNGLVPPSSGGADDPAR